MRIYADRFYVLERVPGISGFQRWAERDRFVITGRKAANNRTAIVSEWTPDDRRYRIRDGHLPEQCPIGGSAEVLRFLAENPYQECELIA